MKKITYANESYAHLPNFHVQEVYVDNLYRGDVYCNVGGLIAMSLAGIHSILMEPDKLSVFGEQLKEYRFTVVDEVTAVLRIVGRNLERVFSKDRISIIDSLSRTQKQIIFGGNNVTIPMINSTLKHLFIKVEEGAGPCEYSDLVLMFADKEVFRITCDVSVQYIKDPSQARSLYKAINNWENGREDYFTKIFKSI